MHERPRRPLSDVVGAALRRCSGRLVHRTGTLLLAALTLGLVAAAAVVVPGLLRPGPATGPQSVVTVDAAAKQALQTSQAGGKAAGAAAAGKAAAGTPAAGTPAAAGAGRGQHHGDHRRAEQGAAAAVAQTKNANCTLLVPADPLSAQGLATPYQLVATDRQAGPCHEADTDQSAFVEAAIYDSTQHTVSIYHPLVVDKGDQPAVPPTPVQPPAGSAVGVWFGFNGDGLTLGGAGAGACVNGLGRSIFGQFAYCGADAFFAKVNADGTLLGKIPALGQARDGQACPTTRDFSVVDQDQSDNLATAYRVIGGRMAQLTPQTAHRGTALTNGSDEGLLAKAIDPALGCTPWTGTDLNNPGTPTAALALNELSAAKWQGTPKALVPATDPMVLVDDRPSTAKTNLYRAGVDMGPITAAETGQAYCRGIRAVAPARLQANGGVFTRAASPTPDQPNLLAFLQNRLTGTLQMLGCTGKQADAATTAPTAAGAAPDQPATQPAADPATATQATAPKGTPAQGAATQGTVTQGTATPGQASTGQATPSSATGPAVTTPSPAPAGTGATRHSPPSGTGGTATTGTGTTGTATTGTTGTTGTGQTTPAG